MSPNNVLCPHCRSLIGTDPAMAGQIAFCPLCRGQFRIPPTSPVPQAGLAQPATGEAAPGASQRPASDTAPLVTSFTPSPRALEAVGKTVRAGQQRRSSLLGSLLLGTLIVLIMAGLLGGAALIRYYRQPSDRRPVAAKGADHPAEAALPTDSPPAREGSRPAGRQADSRKLPILPEDQSVIASLAARGVSLQKGSQGELISVDVSEVSFTDADMPQLAGLPNLQTLILRDSQISDIGLQVVAQLERLTTLDLQHSATSDGGLVHIAKLPKLRYLSLEQTRITDAGLGYLKELEELRFLSLGRNNIFDTGLQHLTGMKQLERLRLHFTKVSDKGTLHLTGLVNLQELNLRNTRVSNQTLDVLAGLPKLRRVDLRGTAVVPQRIEQLATERPKLRIEWTAARTTEPL